MIRMGGLVGIFRDIGSHGIVIFTRDGLLLRQKSPSSDLNLGDINQEFVKLLTQLRGLDVHFGFVSSQRGADAGAPGEDKFAELTRLLDKLLEPEGAKPDFWIGRNQPAEKEEAKANIGGGWKPIDNAKTILRVISWYGIDKKDALFVSSSSAEISAANRVDIMGIRYSCRQHNRRFGAHTPPSASEFTEVQRLGAAIQAKLRLNPRRWP
ncbi:histidinol phosphatase-like enzyme [Neorhizobium sp. 2083]|uniref:hypothetical protein n=1 Tax=Neorhizobium sp. 2083 TaxID=2817762 RepID=UPI002867AC9B|nr:hypothetical protein [Neorhizobium sp. 2083]MDR6820386.1 histidinol phosphatase-like enzyme [Neorhizobium sp. 2083]